MAPDQERGGVMLGVIRKRDVIAHPVVTIQCFGLRVFLKTLIAGKGETFLSLLMSTDVLDKAPRVEVPETVDRCVQLELKAMSLYRRLALRFSEDVQARDFFDALSSQELQHAELLDICREASERTGWASERFERCAREVPGLERSMDGAESTIEGAISLTDALRLVIEIESSEVNRVFEGIVAASDCEFVRALRAFHVATAQHLAYIRERLPALEPRLEDACRALSEGYAVEG